MLVQGVLDKSSNTVVIPDKPLVWVDDGSGGGSGGGGSVTVSNFPATQNVAIVSGSVSVGNWPASQPVSGTVTIDNFPATQAVSGTVSISGTVAVSGPLTNAQLTAVTGTAAQTAIATDPSAAGLTINALLRGILQELQVQTALLEDIKTNTTSAP